MQKNQLFDDTDLTLDVPGEKSQMPGTESRVLMAFRRYCLCYRCAKFVPDKPEANCSIARDLYRNAVTYDMITPVARCRRFKPREEETL